MSLIQDDEARCNGIEVEGSDLPAHYCRDCLRYRQTAYDPQHRMFPYVQAEAKGEPPGCFRCKHRIE